jgi:hypothetical protein
MATKKISDLTLISAMADDVNIPGENTSQTYRVTGAQIKSYIQAQIADLMKSPQDLLNLGLAASVSGNALTISLKQLDGSSAPSSSAPVRIGFRGTTAANGDSSLVSATAATSLVISSGSTLGFTSALEGKIYVYALNNGGTIELAASGSPWDEGSLQSTTAEGGAGAADSGNVLYSTTARTSKAIRLIGVIKATEATAGTWATAPSDIAVAPFAVRKPPTQQRFTSGSGTYTLPSPAPLYLRVRMVGGGGGGGCSGSTAGTAATAGGNTTFGTSLLTANGGAIGQGGSGRFDGGAGGSVTLNSPAFGTSFAGAQGAGNLIISTAATDEITGGAGGATPFGGAGLPQSISTAAANAIANSGSGGGGGSIGATGGATRTGSGGGAGGFIDATIANPSPTYAYTVGTGGTGQTLGTGGVAGGNGGSGYIEVTEYYQ